MGTRCTPSCHGRSPSPTAKRCRRRALSSGWARMRTCQPRRKPFLPVQKRTVKPHRANTLRARVHQLALRAPRRWPWVPTEEWAPASLGIFDRPGKSDGIEKTILTKPANLAREDPGVFDLAAETAQQRCQLLHDLFGE